MVFNFFENSFLYTQLEMLRANTAPMRSSVKVAQEWGKSPYHIALYLPFNNTKNASYELFERITRRYPKPEFNIHRTMFDNKAYYVEEETIVEKTFCRLIHFTKLPEVTHLPKLLIVVPMSGHYATLLKGTVEACLPFFDVYLTEWKNVRDIPLSEGDFDFDDYIDYVIEFMTLLSPNLNVMAVCQPSVPVAAAVAIMSANQSEFLPKNMILIGGPIDARRSPNKISEFTANKDIQWFSNNVITRVPLNYNGFMRQVYPGFLQLAGFMSMNMKRHVGEHIKLFQHLVAGDEDSSDLHKKFYDEYLAVMDLPASFYLQTIEHVFLNYSLPKGELVSRGRKVNLADIADTSLLVIEGELDDITGISQTEAAIDLCESIPSHNKQYLLQAGVGHYGLFNGSKFRNNILPIIKEFSYRNM